MNREAFYRDVREFFGRLKQGQVDGFEILLSATEGLPRSHRAYLLATAWHETARTMQPVRETLAKTDEAAVQRLEKAYRAGRLGQVGTPYWRFDSLGKTWLGRGYVQLTHRDNYAKAAALVGADLLGNPNLALRPDLAAKILVEGAEIGMFTGKKLRDYLPGSYRDARRVINGLDKASLIGGYAAAFERALAAAGASEAPEPLSRREQPLPTKKPASTGKVAAQTGAGVALTAAFLAIATKWAELQAWLASLFGG